jgi:hypothetical protein
MNEKNRPRPTLDKPVAYRIKVPVVLDKSWSGSDGEMTVSVDWDQDGRPVTTLTGTLDQAALHGLLRRLYSLGIPLISVTCFDGSWAAPWA